MKYAQLIIGLLAGTALGGAVVAGTGTPLAGSSMNDEAVKKIVRQVIADEPQLIMDSVQKYQQEASKKQDAAATGMLKDPAIHDALYNSPNNAFVGQKDSKRTIVEFFDYNCPVCKMQLKGLDSILKKDPSVRIIFIEFPIFGPVSDLNAKLGLAVWRLYPEKYYEFHKKMMSTPGHGPGNNEMTYTFMKDLGMNVEKVKAEAAKKDISDIIDKNRELGTKLHVQGTPMLIVGDETIPHAVETEELQSRLDAAAKGDDSAPAPKTDAE